MKDLKERLMDGARGAGICGEGYGAMRARDVDMLVEYYLENPDWCLERGFPDMDTLRRDFGDCGERGVFVGRRFRGELLDGRQVYVFHGCRGTIRVGLNVELGLIPMLYVANGCRLRIVGVGEGAQRGRVVVPVYSFGNNDLSARDNRYVTFKHYHNELI